MSVIVKGMRMPSECRECPFAAYYERSGSTWCNAMEKPLMEEPLALNDQPIKFDGRRPRCPLVEIPTPHGRLIDVDALKLEYGMKDDCNDCEREMRGSVKACEYDTVYTKMNFCEWLDDSPAVIEAEED